ncbi:MAG TPA: PAS domain-containing protein [Steroidobacteraceae bacterium]
MAVIALYMRDEGTLLESDVWTADLGAYEWDITNDRVRWLNRWCESHGIDPCDGERHGERWRALVHPEDRTWARREFDEHMAGRRERYEAEYRVRTATGDWLWIRNRAYIIRSSVDGREERMVGVCVDVDERKRAELALERTQRSLEALAAAAPVWMILTDAQGVVEFVNRPLHCLTAATATGRNILSLFADPAEAARLDEFRKSVIEECTTQMHTMILEDGRALATWARPIMEDDRVVGIASATADVSERQGRERQLLAAINREQRRFGRDLHDGLGQELTGIALLVKSLSNRAEKESPALAAALEEILSHVTTAITTTRAVARGVSPVGREQGGLAHALQDLARQWRETRGANIKCRVEISHARELEPMLADNFYRIAQEALTNAMQHSGASEILMELRHSERRLSLTVTDDGRGITPAADRGGGLGLHIMRGRAELAGAQLKVGTCEGSGGTRIECHYIWRGPGRSKQAFG